MSDNAWPVKPGELCPRLLQMWDLVNGVCMQCGHVDYLHSPGRPCAGCEAIAEAIKAAKAATSSAGG
jgi:hypothetical protein